MATTTEAAGFLETAKRDDAAAQRVYLLHGTGVVVIVSKPEVIQLQPRPPF